MDTSQGAAAPGEYLVRQEIFESARHFRIEFESGRSIRIRIEYRNFAGP